MLQYAGMKLYVTTELWQATNKTFFGEAGIVFLADIQQLQSEGNKQKRFFCQDHERRIT